MSNTFQDAVLQIKNQVDILEIVSNEVILKKRGSNYWGLCPFHGEKTPSFSVNPERGFFKGFGCGVGGDSITFLMKIHNWDYIQTIKYLAELYHIELPEYNGNYKKNKEEHAEMLEAFQTAVKFYSDKLLSEDKDDIAMSYLAKRDITPAVISSYNLGLSSKAPDDLYKKLKLKYSDNILENAGLILKSNKGGYIDRFRNRIMIPIQNEQGDFVAFGARALEEGQAPKYLNSSDSLIYNKSRLLYGLYTAKEAIRKEDAVILMEGYFDVISSQAHGIENCVASCGTSLTAEHVRLLSRYTKSRRIYLSFDTDSAGQKATARGASVIKEVFEGLGDIKQFDESYVATNNDKYSCEIRVIAPPEGKDPDEFVRSVGAEAYKMYIENAPLFIDFRIDSILKQKDNYKTPQERAQYISSIIPVLCEIKNTIIRAEYIESVSQVLGIDSSVIKSEVESYERANSPKPERIVKNVTKSNSILQKAQKNLLSVFLVPDNHFSFAQINEMMSDVAFDDKILIIVKSTIDKSICTVNNVKELIEHLYTEFVDNAEAQALLPELIEHAQSYRGLSDEEFENAIHEMIAKINKCKHIEEAKNNKELYKGIDDNDPEALKLQIQLRDKLKKIRQKSEMN